MSRKGINKYYPPDMDPRDVKFSVKTPKQNPSVRLMVPFSMKCATCNEYIAKSRKFNAKKETSDRDYLGIKIIRFRIRCPRCYAELIFETDPKNGDYSCVEGCKKNYERAKEVKEKETVDEMIARVEKEMKEDANMKEMEKKGRNRVSAEESGVEQLEKRLAEQQKEKERLEDLEELQERISKLDQKKRKLDTFQADVEMEEEKRLEKEAKLAFDAFKEKQKEQTVSNVSNSNNLALAKDYSDSDEDSEDEATLIRRPAVTINVNKRKKPKIIT